MSGYYLRSSLGKNDLLLYGGLALVGGGAFGIYFGCDWKIQFLCDIRTQIEQMLQPGGDIGGDTTDTGGDTSGQPAKKSLSAAINWYATKISEDLDRYNGGDLNRTTKLNIKGYLLSNQKSKLTTIANSVDNDTGLPLQGKAKYLYAECTVTAASKFNINIPSKIRSDIYAILEGGYKAYKSGPDLYSYMTISVA